MLSGRWLTSEILVPQQLDFVGKLRVNAWVSGSEDASVARVKPAGRYVDVLGFNLELPALSSGRPCFRCGEER